MPVCFINHFRSFVYGTETKDLVSKGSQIGREYRYFIVSYKTNQMEDLFFRDLVYFYNPKNC